MEVVVIVDVVNVVVDVTFSMACRWLSIFERSSSTVPGSS